MDRFARTRWLLGAAAMERLAASTVLLFGVGGVGSFAAEGLARAGVGGFVLVDMDTIAPSNLNRQIHALTETVGEAKVSAMRRRILAIHPEARVEAVEACYLPETAEAFFARRCDYIVDAVDMVTAKIDLAVQAAARGIPIISSMGTGNKLDPTRFEVADLYETSVCPLARVMRKELRARGVKALKVVYSKEEPLAPQAEEAPLPGKRQTPGSVSFVPSVAGLILAGEVVKDLIAGCGAS